MRVLAEGESDFVDRTHIKKKKPKLEVTRFGSAGERGNQRLAVSSVVGEETPLKNACITPTARAASSPTCIEVPIRREDLDPRCLLPTSQV
jgi:hypothetical protein